MMIPAALVSVGVLVMTLALIIRMCGRFPCLARWHGMLVVCYLLWWLMPIAKIAWLDEIFPPRDAIGHERIARAIADQLRSADISAAMSDVKPGNEAYRFGLGVFYYLTHAPEYVTYLINGTLAFCGSMILLGRLSTLAPLSGWMLVTIALFPSTLFWATANLKEGLMYWVGCLLLAPSIGLGTRQFVSRKGPGFWVALGVGLCLRPHVTAGWLAAEMAARRTASGMIGRSVGMAGVLLVAALSFRAADENMFSQLLTEGSGTALQTFYTERESTDGSAIHYATGRPIPFLSGAILILLRPFPTEIHSLAELLAGAEVWLLSGVFALGVARSGSVKATLSQRSVMSALCSLIVFSFLFSGMYNMGLMVRQRVQVLPALFAVSLIPHLLRKRALLTSRDSLRAPRVLWHDYKLFAKMSPHRSELPS